VGQVKVSEQVDAEMCDYNNNNNNGLIIEIQLTWNVKTKIIPIGTTSKSFRKHLSNIPGKARNKKMYRKQPNWARYTFLGKY
jgi:hypothetical protein